VPFLKEPLEMKLRRKKRVVVESRNAGDEYFLELADIALVSDAEENRRTARSLRGENNRLRQVTVKLLSEVVKNLKCC
jgi:hypothetical protein